MSAPRGALGRAWSWRGRAGAAALLLLALWEIGVLLHARESAPTDENWRAASRAVREAADKDALIVFAPRWIDPVGRLWLGDRISIDQAARMDAVRYRQVWEVSVRGAAAPDVAREAPISERWFGAVRVREFVRPAPAIAWDTRSRSQLQEVDFEPRRGVVLELRRADDERRARFDRVDLGTELQAYAGLANYRSRQENRGTALLRILVDGREVTRGLVDNESGWRPFPMARIEPGVHDVEFVARVDHASGPIVLSVSVAAESRVAP